MRCHQAAQMLCNTRQVYESTCAWMDIELSLDRADPTRGTMSALNQGTPALGLVIIILYGCCPALPHDKLQAWLSYVPRTTNAATAVQLHIFRSLPR